MQILKKKNIYYISHCTMLTFDLTLVDSIKLSESESEKTRFVCAIPVMIQSQSHRTPVHHVRQSENGEEREGGGLETPGGRGGVTEGNSRWCCVQ